MSQPDLFSARAVPGLQPGVWELCQNVMRVADNEHRMVLQVLLDAVATSSRIRTQADLAIAVPSIGAHRRETEAIPHMKRKRDTTLRKVRQIVRDLRVQYGIPILSSPQGYWLPRDEAEVDSYVERAEKQARATAASWFETYRAVRPFASRGGATLDLFATSIGDQE